ncbi:DUF1642 domain-containing protein [Streptococcus suis]|nr:DUF1642 domain-containing protein [Streptococcus suis]NQP28044.1 DUF1642 domain-containing protein [Streptococcus suis]NQP37398.1 DUF1642 domain-containing protein [Streptococcus suis]
MNKQEFEKQAEALYTDVRSFLDNTFELIDQIDQPQNVVVPKFVAEWIEKCKDMNCSLRDAMKNTKLSAELNAWFLKTGQDMFTYPNQETFARAWLDGYEIEQEKLYVVTDGNKLYLKEFDELNAIIIIDDVVGAVDYAKRYEDKTKAQQAADELGWIVQEVE